MAQALKLMCVLAHPDDESLGTGGILAKYAAEGVATSLVCATRGERGWKGKPEDYPGPEALGRHRTEELGAAARVLAIRRVDYLGYLDGELDRVDAEEAVVRIAGLIREVRPQVVVTFGPDGAYGHPDHIAISQFATAAVLQAASSDFGEAPPHTVRKLYYMAETRAMVERYEAVVGEVKKLVDGTWRRAVAWEEWAVSARVDTSPYWRHVKRAVACHRSQLRDGAKLMNLPDEVHARLWGEGTFYRALSLVNGGCGLERDLFTGLR